MGFLDNINFNKDGYMKAIWSAVALIIVGGVVWGGIELYNAYNGLPQKLSVAPNPLFEVEDYISADISGVFRKHSMPRNSRLIITPYIKSAGVQYYGTPVVYLGASCKGEGTVVRYEQQTPVSFHLHMLNPASHEKTYLYLHFDRYKGDKLLSTHNKKLERVWNIASLEKENEAYKAIPNVFNQVGCVFILLAIVGFIVGVRLKKGYVFYIIAAGNFIIGMMFFIPSSAVLSRIDLQYETIHSQYEKAKRLKDIPPAEEKDKVAASEEDEDNDIDEPEFSNRQDKKQK